jgi:hypothetical protein
VDRVDPGLVGAGVASGRTLERGALLRERVGDVVAVAVTAALEGVVDNPAGGSSRWASTEPNATGEITTDVPTSFQATSEPAGPDFSQSGCALPVIVRSESSTEPLPTGDCWERKVRRPRGGGGAGPQEDTVERWVAGGDAVQEGGSVGGACAGGGAEHGGHDNGGGSGLHERAAAGSGETKKDADRSRSRTLLASTVNGQANKGRSPARREVAVRN